MIRIPEAVEMDVVAGPGAEGARRAAGGPGPVTTSRPSDPDPEVPATVQRRRFSAEYRFRILKQADACKQPGEAGALREMRGRRRGPRPVDPRMKQLEAENRRLQRKLQRAETIITLQKKVAEILGIPLTPLDDDETD